MMTFEERKNHCASNLYKSMVENYIPIPQYVLDEEEFIVSLLQTAWIDGANWRLAQIESERKQ